MRTTVKSLTQLGSKGRDLRRSGLRRRRHGLVMLLTVIGFVAVSATPAAAEPLVTAGAGAGTGFEFSGEPDQECGTVPLGILTGARYDNVVFELNHAVTTYDSVDQAVIPIASFVGATNMHIEIAPVVQAPQGARPGACGGIVTPAPVPITNVTVESVGDGVSCDSYDGNGFYLRVNTTVVFEFLVSCDITGNVPLLTGTVENVLLRHRVVGNQIPCLPPLFAPCFPLDERETTTSLMQTEFEADSPTF